MAKRRTLPPKATKLIGSIVDRIFARVKAKFLGWQPVTMRTTFTPVASLPGMFAAANAEEGSKPDTDRLARMMHSANEYLDAHKAKAKAKMVREVAATLEEAHAGGIKTDLHTVLQGKVSDVLGETERGVRTVVEEHTQTTKNLGVMDGIIAVNVAADVADPVVAFLVAARLGPDAPCEECLKLHTTGGIGSPPRVWLMSELSHGFHKKGDPYPSISGLHPNCRCSMVTVLPGFGFDGTDELHWMGNGYSELENQRG